MDKQVSIKNIEKIIKSNKYETSEISYKCGDDEVVKISVNPCPGYSTWYNSIDTACGILVDEEIGYRPALTSVAYELALIACFTNIKTDNTNKVIELAKSTDIVKNIEEALPWYVLDTFRSDFECTRDAKEKSTSPLAGFGGLISGVKTLIDEVAAMPEENIQKLFGELNSAIEG